MAIEKYTHLSLIVNVSWAAGFLEGEGWFGCQGNSPRVSAGQAQLEPLERLTHIFGGKISLRKKTSGLGTKPIYSWHTTSRRSVQIMMTIYCLMSPVRQAQIRSVIERWKLARSLRSHGAVVCLRGHSISGYNAKRVPGRKFPICRQCKNDTRRMRRRRQRLGQ